MESFFYEKIALICPYPGQFLVDFRDTHPSQYGLFVCDKTNHSFLFYGSYFLNMGNNYRKTGRNSGFSEETTLKRERMPQSKIKKSKVKQNKINQIKPE